MIHLLLHMHAFQCEVDADAFACDGAALVFCLYFQFRSAVF